MKTPANTVFDLTAALMEEWIPMYVDRHDTSADAQLIFLGLLAIAEQLKEARPDERASLRGGNRPMPQGGRNEQ
jgi:hypothetical protein